MSTITVDPTFRDFAEAARFMARHGGTAKSVEELAGWMAAVRALERERIAKAIEVAGRASASNWDAAFAQRGAAFVRALVNEGNTTPGGSDG